MYLYIFIRWSVWVNNYQELSDYGTSLTETNFPFFNSCSALVWLCFFWMSSCRKDMVWDLGRQSLYIFYSVYNGHDSQGLIFAFSSCVTCMCFLTCLFCFLLSISLFIATNICETIVWKAFSPATINTGRGESLFLSGNQCLCITQISAQRMSSHASTYTVMANKTVVAVSGAMSWHSLDPFSTCTVMLWRMWQATVL